MGGRLEMGLREVRAGIKGGDRVKGGWFVCGGRVEKEVEEMGKGTFLGRGEGWQSELGRGWRDKEVTFRKGENSMGSGGKCGGEGCRRITYERSGWGG